MSGWFDDVVHAVTHPASLVSDAEHGLGSLIDDGAHALGSGLSDVGLAGAGQWVDRAGDDVANFLGAQVPEEQLGQTTDRAELIHGDPAALRSAAGKLRAFSGAFSETASGLDGLEPDSWTGAAADAFRAKYAPQPGRWRDAATGCGDGAEALESYAGTVQWAQGQARDAIEVYEQGQRATAAAVSAYDGRVSAYNQAAQAYDNALAAGRSPGPRPVEPGAFSDPGAALRERAQQILAAARAERDRAGAAAAGKVRAATDLAPAEPSFGQRLLDDAEDLGQADELASVSFGSGILTGASDIVKTARAVDPLDPWNVTHLAEYGAGMSAMAAGLVHDEMHPIDAVEGLVGTGWGSDPAQAAGKLVPSLLLAAATDGAGDAANAARVPEDDMTLLGDPIDVASGDVVLAQTDLTLAGIQPVTVRRVHRSSYRAGRWFGRTWASTLDQRLEVSEQAVCLAGADSAVLRYPVPGADGEPVLPVTGARWPLARDGAGYTVTDPQAGIVYRFEARSGYYVSAAGHGELPLVSITGRSGHRIGFEHGTDGAPAAVTHDGGYRVLVLVSGSRVTGLDLAGAGPSGGDLPLIRYGYDDTGNLAEIINSSGQPQRLSYDGEGRLTGWQDRNGWSYRYAYDEQGRCVRGDGPDGTLSAALSYDRDHLVTTHTDAAGAVSVYQFTDRYQVAAATDPAGHATRSEYDAFGRLVSRTDPLGRTTAWSYDDAGNLAAITRPDGSRATASYDDANLPLAVTEPGGAIWRQDYDAAGNLVRRAGPDGAVTRYSYDARGHLARVTGPTGAVTRVTCDAAGLPVEATGPDGSVTGWERDGFGRVVAVTEADRAVTRLAWTTEGQLASRTFPDGTAERFSYDGEGNLVAHVSPAAGLTKLEYGSFDQIASRTGPDGTRAEFTYDRCLRLTEVRFGGLAWRYDYDPAGRLVAETDVNGAVTRYAHDAAGAVIGQVNAAEQAVSYAYDQLGNLISRRAEGVETSFGYDASGLLIHAACPDAVLAIERDPLGRVTAETCNGAAVSSSYDLAGRRVRRVTPSGAETVWAYDVTGRPIVLRAGGRELRFGYDLVGRETSRELPGGVRLAQEFDPVGRLAAQVLTAPAPTASPSALTANPLAQLRTPPDALAARPLAPPLPPAIPGTGDVLQRRGYSYRADGVLSGVEDLLAGPRRFTLDPAGRVTGVHGPGWDETYGYDPAGNITAATWPAPPGPAAAWAGPGVQGAREYTGTLITRAGDIRYRHDAQGRIITRQQVRLSRKPDTWHYTWDADNRLVSVTTPDGSTWRYLYDPLGRRVAKQRLSADGQVTEETRFIWDGPVLAEQSTLGTVAGSPRPAWLAAPGGDTGAADRVITWDYEPGAFTPLAQREHASWRRAPQDHVDQEFYAIVTDLIGAPAELVGPDGSLAGYQQHTLWGTTLWKPGGAATPLRFPGQYADPETGLHYNNHRYYDPLTGRYLSPDPLGLAPAPNPHTYVPNPTIATDPLGLVGQGCVSGPGGTEASGSGYNPANLGQSYDGRVVVEDPQIKITGLRGSANPDTPFHALDRVLARGVSPQDIVNTMRSPSVVLEQGGGSRYLYLSNDAAVVIRPDGQVVTAWGAPQFNAATKQILREAQGG